MGGIDFWAKRPAHSNKKERDKEQNLPNKQMDLEVETSSRNPPFGWTKSCTTLKRFDSPVQKVTRYGFNRGFISWCEGILFTHSMLEKGKHDVQIDHFQSAKLGWEYGHGPKSKNRTSERDPIQPLKKALNCVVHLPQHGDPIGFCGSS